MWLKTWYLLLILCVRRVGNAPHWLSSTRSIFRCKYFSKILFALLSVPPRHQAAPLLPCRKNDIIWIQKEQFLLCFPQTRLILSNTSGDGCCIIIWLRIYTGTVCLLPMFNFFLKFHLSLLFYNFWTVYLRIFWVPQEILFTTHNSSSSKSATVNSQWQRLIITFHRER